jgi:hypothetical protein
VYHVLKFFYYKYNKYEDYKNIIIPKVITIIRKIKNVLINELSSSSRETKVDSFIMTLLNYLGL